MHEAKTNQLPPALHYVLREKLQSVRVNQRYQYHIHINRMSEANCHKSLSSQASSYIFTLGQIHLFFNLHQFLLAPSFSTHLVAGHFLQAAQCQWPCFNCTWQRCKYEYLRVAGAASKNIKKQYQNYGGVKSEANHKCIKILTETILHMSFLP